MGQIIKGLLIACVLSIFSLSTYAQKTVVVIPMGGNDAPTSKAVFITQEDWNGNLGGSTGADAKCQAEADLQGSKVQGRPFRAWVSGLTSDFTAGGRTFIKSELPYKLVDGTLVANDYADLVNGDDLVADINIEANGLRAVDFRNVWTGIKLDGTNGVNCKGWTSGSNFVGGIQGDSFQLFGTWTDTGAANAGCDNIMYLYCFEQ